MTKTQSLIAIPAIVATLLAGGALAGYATLASAQSSGAETSAQGKMMGKRDRGPHVHGTVTAVSGTTITITDDRTDTAYTIDASSATFKKAAEGSAPTTVTISEIAIGDKVGAMGTLSGTTLKATHVTEGEFGRGGPGGKGGHGRGPGVMGKVTAVNGSTITVTGHDGAIYTVNAGSASIHKMAAGALSDIAVGDTIGVHGDVSGTTVTAKTIMADMPMHTAPTTQ
ncbi:MAG: hypothetical protein KBD06_00980 [Candidatus Pacebacteria bacterium]|nr:hypothetical protein [Candidatus Paceibacterota bacterium]